MDVVKGNTKINISNTNKQDKKVLVENLNNKTQPREVDGDDEIIISDAMGYIEINKLGVTLPIFSGTSKKELREGVGVVEILIIQQMTKIR